MCSMSQTTRHTFFKKRLSQAKYFWSWQIERKSNCYLIFNDLKAIKMKISDLLLINGGINTYGEKKYLSKTENPRIQFWYITFSFAFLKTLAICCFNISNDSFLTYYFEIPYSVFKWKTKLTKYWYDFFYHNV